MSDTNIKITSPIVLFPVKLETRFVDDNQKLRIRVYPDQIAVDGHVEELTYNETLAGNTFWNNQDDRQGAWRALCRRFGAERSAWIIKNTPAALPTSQSDAGSGVLPKTEVMPDRFVFYLYIGEEVLEAVGEGIPDALSVGPFSGDENGSNEETGWMFDFEQAKDVGMAVEIDLTNWDAWTNLPGDNKEISKIVAIGVQDQQLGESKLEKLFRNHRYSNGLRFIPPGTPTNNTGDVSAGYSTATDPDHSYNWAAGDTLFRETDDIWAKSDGQILAEALNIDPAVFHHVQGSGDFTRRNARAMNTALWQATLGPYLEEILNYYNPGEHLFRNGEEVDLVSILDQIRAFMLDHVMGRGVFPTISVGKQPYGIMPISSLSAWAAPDVDVWPPLTDNQQFTPHEKLPEFTFENRLTRVLKRFYEDWEAHFFDNLSTVADAETGEDFHRKFMDILGLQPHSVAYYRRFVMETIKAETYHLPSTDIHHRDFFDDLGGREEEGERLLFDDLKYLANFRLLDGTYVNTEVGEDIFLDRYIPMVTQIWDRRGLPIGQEVRNFNYIDFLSRINPDRIIQEMKEGDELSDTLLFLLLRTALLNQYWDAAMRIFEKEGLRDFRVRNAFREEDIRMYIPNSHLVYFENDHGYDLKWDTILDKVLGSIDDEDNNLYQLLSYFLPQNVFSNDTVLSESFLNEHWLEKKLQRSRYREFVLSPNITKLTELNALDSYTSNLVSLNLATLDADGYFSKSQGKTPFLFIKIHKGDLPRTGILTDPIPMWKYIKANKNDFPAETYQLDEFNQSLQILAQLPTAELERLLAEHIDLCSYRLDAWWLGLMHNRLKEIREIEWSEIGHSGTFIGAYGYVEHLRPKTQKTNDDQGFIHAPSLNQAVAAAILRSGFESTGDNSAAAVNLSSGHIQKALYYQDGMRNGRPLGELLGYQFERRLHDADMDQYIYDIRKDYTFSGVNSDTTSVSPLQDRPGLQILDGERLLEEPPTAWPIDDSLSQAQREMHEQKLNEALEQTRNDLDAVSDVLLAEGVYQLSMGNYERANAAMSVLNQGGIPSELEVLKTPRTGHGLTHRVCIQWKIVTDNSAPPNWPSSMTPRAVTEPSFNYWLGQIIGDPNKISCTLLDRENSEEETGIPVRLSELELQPVDVFCLFQEPDKRELRKRIYRAASHQNQRREVAAYSSDFDIQFDRSQGDGMLSFEQVESILALLHELLNSGRPLRSEDLTLPGQNITSSDGGLGELRERAERAVAHLNIQISEIEKYIRRIERDIWFFQVGNRFGRRRFETKNYTGLLQVFAYVSCYGIEELIAERKPQGPLTVKDAQGLLQKAESVIRILQTKKQTFEQILPKQDTQVAQIRQQEQYQAAFRTLFGQSFTVYPSYKHPEFSSILSAWERHLDDQQHQFVPDRPLIMEEWLAGVGRVREKMDTLEQVMILNNFIRPESEHEWELKPVQFPFYPNDHWTGLEVPAAYYQNHPPEISKNKLSIVFLASDPPRFPTWSFGGVLIDEWTESIPEPEATTGMTFNYNQPSNEAPQTVLIAVHPNGVELGRHRNIENFVYSKWKLEEIKDVVCSAIELAKLRAVEPDQILASGEDQVYPALLPAVMSRILSVDPRVDVDFSMDFGTVIKPENNDAE